MVASENLIIPFKESEEKLEKADKLTEDDKSTFNNDTFDTVILKAGMHLWRFSSQKKYNPFSNCWIDSDAMNDLMNYFHFIGKFDSKFKKQHIRNQLAILEHWNKLEYRVKILLKKDVIAHVGTIKSQKVFVEVKPDTFIFKRGEQSKIEKATEYRIGGFKQYFIPRLKNKSVSGDDNEYAKIVHFAHI